MNRQKWILVSAVAVLIAGAVGVLERAQAGHRLGLPGVKVSAAEIYGPNGKIASTNSIELPRRVLDFTSVPGEISEEELLWLPKDTTYGRRFYRSNKDSFETMINVVLMGTDRTSIHKPEICLEGQGWVIERAELDMIRVEKPEPYDLPVKKLAATRKGRLPDGRVQVLHGMYVYWFVTENRITARHGERMWWMAKDLLATGTLPRWAYVSYFATCLPGEEQILYNRMKDFIAASVPEFQIVNGSTAIR